MRLWPSLHGATMCVNKLHAFATGDGGSTVLSADTVPGRGSSLATWKHWRVGPSGVRAPPIAPDFVSLSVDTSGLRLAVRKVPSALDRGRHAPDRRYGEGGTSAASQGELVRAVARRGGVLAAG